MSTARRPNFTDPWRAWNVARFMVPAEADSAKLVPFTISKAEAQMERMRAAFNPSRGGRFVPKGRYLMLKLKDETGGWYTMMSDTPDECRDHFEVIGNAAGRVLIHGLGLGCVLSSLLTKAEVTHIDVVEANPDVIALVAPYYEHDERVEIHLGDCSTYEWPAGTRWNYVWHDIWSEISADNLDDAEAEHGISYGHLHRKFGGRCDNQGSWAFHMARRVRRQERGFKTRASRFAFVWNHRATQQERYAMLIQETCPVVTTTEDWRQVAEEIPAPNGDEGATLADQYRAICAEPITLTDATILLHRG